MGTGTASHSGGRAIAKTIAESKRLYARSLRLREKLREQRDSLTLTRELCKHGLQAGLTLKGVRHRLAGWADHPIWVADLRGGHCCATWDFVPPDGDRERLRLTFFDDRLIVWGRPAATR